jgi:hypothetical protein
LFSYACETLTQEARHPFTPEYTLGLLDIIAERGDRDALKKIRSIDRLVDALLSCQLELAARQFAEDQRDRIGQGCFFVGMLADIVLRLPDRELLRLSRSNVRQPLLEELKADPGEAIGTSLGHLAPKVPEQDLRGLRDVLRRWAPRRQAVAALRT